MTKAASTFPQYDGRRNEDQAPTSSGFFPLDAGGSRQSPRAPVVVQVDFFSDHNFWSGLTMNMSEGGLFLATYDAVRIGTQIVLKIVLPFEKEPIVTRARVRWRRETEESDDVPPGVGLQFVDIDPISLAKIRRFVSAVREPLLFED
jgi:uncharacterized protein (TIGR02266 family)